MMTKKNLAKAVTLSLLLSTVLSSNAWALEISNETISDSSIQSDDRFKIIDSTSAETIYAAKDGGKISLNNIKFVNDSDKNIHLESVEKLDKVNINGELAIKGGVDEQASGNNLLIQNVTSENFEELNITVYGGVFEYGIASDNTITIENSEIGVIQGAVVSTFDPNSGTKANKNVINLNGVKVYYVYGTMGGAEVKENGIIISGGTEVISDVTVAYGCVAKDNYLTVKGNENDLSKAFVAGYMASNIHENNALNLESFNGKIYNLSNFDKINYEKLDLNKLDVVTINKSDGGLENTKINIISFAGGQNFEVGKTVDLLKVEDKDSWDKSFTNLNKQTTTNAGVAQVITSDIAKDEANQTITATIKGVELADQTMLVAENRAVAAAFVNQGTDLIADSLDILSRDGKYGVKTFAAVHGNRSKYDVNSDIKINGWSTIVGVGSETEHNGGDFSWGVFYENGSGNYRTFNSFNNEYFRGDGSLVYNGGGIAARYENAHGVYTEGSLRAGMLKSDMDNALSDGENKYGYSSESEYYGAHIGIGQIIPLSESSDLDVYGKFFHTYTEGDSFKVDTDEFEFDSINSDRLRVGARLTTNKENKFSTYYGLAYEYEFNGDAEMRAAGMNAPTQSLQGSSYMAEVGFNYQPTPDSPWSFDLNMRGYAGEREGATFNVQATYTF